MHDVLYLTCQVRAGQRLGQDPTRSRELRGRWQGNEQQVHSAHLPTSSSRLWRRMGPCPLAMVVKLRSLHLRRAVSTERALGRMRQS